MASSTLKHDFPADNRRISIVALSPHAVRENDDRRTDIGDTTKSTLDSEWPC